ncbi:hypothetical protein MCHI_002764 [Candidatus Magnetoovum chiemensis]|nr:hypothetical protein MCHI_002764 [Candidatus Magnetoovum chiemensis]
MLFSDRLNILFSRKRFLETFFEKKGIIPFSHGFLNFQKTLIGD